MKSVLLSIVFCFIFFFAQAQKTNFNYSKQHAKAMALFVENIKPIYVKGQTFEDFEKMLIANATNTPEGTALLKKAYQFLVEGTTKQIIETNYTGLELDNALKFCKKLSKPLSKLEEITVFGGVEVEKSVINQQSKSSGCRWYQLMCLMEQASK